MIKYLVVRVSLKTGRENIVYMCDNGVDANRLMRKCNKMFGSYDDMYTIMEYNCD